MDQGKAQCDIDLTRRGFGKLTAAGLLALTLPGCSGRATARGDGTGAGLAYAGGDESQVILEGVPRGGGDEATVRAVQRAAQAVTDFSWLTRGDTVVIKPVCNSGNVYPATTDPAALRAMIGLLHEKGAGRVVVADMSGVEYVRFSKDGLTGSTRVLMDGNGMRKAIEESGAELHAFEEHGWDSFYEERPAAGANWSQPVMMPNLLKEADHIVLMPRCARHLLAGSTLGLKAAVGWWRHDSRLEYHRDAATFSEKTAEANTVPTLLEKQRLVLSSATKVMTTFGPDRGYVVEPETGLVIAGTSTTAHDMVSLAWLLHNRAVTPASERDGMMDDPNTSPMFVNVANRVVTRWLGGFGEALRTEWLTRYDLGTVWDDRVLCRAFQMNGGVPRVQVADADGTVPGELRAKLAGDLILPT